MNRRGFLRQLITAAVAGPAALEALAAAQPSPLPPPDVKWVWGYVVLSPRKLSPLLMQEFDLFREFHMTADVVIQDADLWQKLYREQGAA